MPTYEYECQKCGHAFERFQSMTEAPVKTCPDCRGRKVKRLIGTGAGLLFKGSGFYTTDYRSDSYRKAANLDKKPADKPKDSPAKTGKTAAKSSASPKKG